MKNAYIPNRNDIVWLDFEPAKGKEMGKYRPALVLTSKVYNRETHQLICCPISTSVRGHIMEVAVRNLEKPCAVIANILRTVEWKARQVKFIIEAEEGVLEATLQRIIPLIGADQIFLSMDVSD